MARHSPEWSPHQDAVNDAGLTRRQLLRALAGAGAALILDPVVRAAEAWSTPPNDPAPHPTRIEAERSEPFPGLSVRSHGLTLEVQLDQSNLGATEFEHIVVALMNPHTTQHPFEQTLMVRDNKTPQLLHGSLATLRWDPRARQYVQAVKVTGFPTLRAEPEPSSPVVVEIFELQTPVVLFPATGPLGITVAADRLETSTFQDEYRQLVDAQVMAKVVNELITFQTTAAGSPESALIRSLYVYQGLRNSGGFAHYPSQSIVVPIESLEHLTLFSSTIVHEATHFISHSFSGTQRATLKGRYYRFLALAGFEFNPAVGGIAYQYDPQGVPSYERNPVIQTIDESTVHATPRGWRHGHPYDSAEEMFSSLIASLATAPGCVEAQLAQLDPATATMLQREVFQPCLELIGPEFGARLLGPIYKRYTQSN